MLEFWQTVCASVLAPELREMLLAAVTVMVPEIFALQVPPVNVMV